MKKFIKFLLKSDIGKALVETLLSKFIMYLRSEYGIELYRGGRAVSVVLEQKAVSDFCEREVSKL
jgi:hypothetical protein